jgi:hypothetical protein
MGHDAAGPIMQFWRVTAEFRMWNTLLPAVNWSVTGVPDQRTGLSAINCYHYSLLSSDLHPPNCMAHLPVTTGKPVLYAVQALPMLKQS